VPPTTGGSNHTLPRQRRAFSSTTPMLKGGERSASPTAGSPS
jgi:hypothetical protein